jgi:hypothetical protein
VGQQSPVALQKAFDSEMLRNTPTVSQKDFQATGDCWDEE